MIQPTARNHLASPMVALLTVASLLGSVHAARAEEPDEHKDRRGILVRLEAIQREGGGGWTATFDYLADSGKAAEFDDSIGARIGADFELVPRLWLRVSVGHAEPVLEVTTLRPIGEPETVQRARVSMTPVLLGLEYRPREWRGRRFLWGIGVQWARVFYGGLPSVIEAELESPETSWGFDLRLDIRIAKSRWLAGIEFGALLPGPSIKDGETGSRNTAHFGGILWAVGVSREF